MKELYTPKEVLQVIEMERKTFDQQVQRGIIKPSVPSRGIGRPAQYSLQDIVVIELTQRLGGVGMSLKSASNIATFFSGLDILFLGLEKGVVICVDLDNPCEKNIKLQFLDAESIEIPYEMTLAIKIRPLIEKIRQKLDGF